MGYRWDAQLKSGIQGERLFEHMMAEYGRTFFKTPLAIDKFYKFDYWELTKDWPYGDGPQRWEVKFDKTAASSGRLFFETYSVFNHVDGPEREVLGWANRGGSAADTLCMIVPSRPVARAYIFDMPTIHNMFAPGGAWANEKEIKIQNDDEQDEFIYHSKGVALDFEVVEHLIVSVLDVPNLQPV